MPLSTHSSVHNSAVLGDSVAASEKVGWGVVGAAVDGAGDVAVGAIGVAEGVGVCATMGAGDEEASGDGDGDGGKGDGWLLWFWPRYRNEGVGDE